MLEARRDAFRALGCIVEEATPDFGPVDEVFMAFHSQQFVVDRELQLRDHRDKLKADIAFRDIRPEEYAGIVLSGGRAPEYIRYDEDLMTTRNDGAVKFMPGGSFAGKQGAVEFIAPPINTIPFEREEQNLIGHGETLLGSMDAVLARQGKPGEARTAQEIGAGRHVLWLATKPAR